MKELIESEIKRLREENKAIIRKLADHNYRFKYRVGPVPGDGWRSACDLLDMHLLNCIKIDLLTKELKRID